MGDWEPRRCARMTPERSLMVFSGRGNPELSRSVAEKLGIELGRVEIKTFADGEIYVKYGESIRGADVFIIQPTCRPVNENLMGASYHDPGGATGLSTSGHSRGALDGIFPPGQEELSTGADYRPAGGRHHPGGWGRPGRDHGSPCRSIAGILQRPRGSHDRALHDRRLLQAQGTRGHGGGPPTRVV